MSKSTRLKRNFGVRSKRRLVASTKWELPLGDSKPYWDKICGDIESKVLKKVRIPLSPTSFPYPIISPSSIHDSIVSSVSPCDLSDTDFPDRCSETDVVKISVPESRSETSPLHSEEPTKSSNYKIKSQEPKKLLNDTTKSPDKIENVDQTDWSKNSCSFTKISMMTKLVNNFLSNIRIRGRPITSKKFSPFAKVSSEVDSKSSFAKSLDSDPKNHSVECESFVGERSPEGSRDEAGTTEGIVPNKKSVGFRENVEEAIEKDVKDVIENNVEEKDEIASVTRPRRARAPSLSVASAVPSFGKVIISIEDIDSLENDEDVSDKFTNQLALKDDATMSPEEQRIDEEKPHQDYLKVPQMKATMITSYPIHEESKNLKQDETKERQFAKKAHESKLLIDSEALGRKQALWPKRSLINVFRAVKTMSTGLRSKAQVESETNRFFALPLETYSPSLRSSISSDDQIDASDVNIPGILEQNDDGIMDEGARDDENESEGKIDRGSTSSSYTSVRQRLMRNAVAHLSKDSQRRAAGTCIDTDNAPVSTSEQGNPSSFYTSWATGDAGDVRKHRNKKTSEPHFIGIARLARIYPRAKADKCLACMCQSLNPRIDQSRRRKTRGTLIPDEIANDDYSDDNETLSQVLNSDLTPRDTFFRERYVESSKTLVNFAKEDTTRDNRPLETAEVESKSLIDESPISPGKNGSQVEESSKPQPTRSPTTTLIAATSIIGLVSERSRSVSDQDDSEQGAVEPIETDGGQGGNATSKFLAPCHMPINLKPSLEPLKALRSKKSRSIRSRVASAEKSGDSGNEDENDSDYEDNTERLTIEGKKKLDTEICIAKLENLLSPRVEKSRKSSPRESEGIEEKERTDTQSPNSIDEAPKIDLSDDAPIMSDHEVIEITKKCLENNLPNAEIFRILANEYCNRMTLRRSESHSPHSQSNKKNEKIAMNLLTLLAESKSHLNRGRRSYDPYNPLSSSKQPSLSDSRQLRRILPLKSYNLVAPILGLAKWYPSKKISTLRDAAKRATRMEKKEKTTESAFDLIVHPPSRLEQNVSFEKSWKVGRPKLSPYSLFLHKPRRKVVTWRPLTERDLEGYDPEATLKKRAAIITDRICVDFCQWLESLAAGTDHTSGIDVEVLKDMFETDFTAEVCSTMQIEIKEMPMVPTAIAMARNCPGAGELALTRRHLVKDARAERTSKRTVGFGTCLPDYLKFVPPRNRVDEKWLQCESVPKELESMEAVWKGITHLASVQNFIKWLKTHPEVKRPKGLENMLATRKSRVPRKSVIADLQQLELDRDQIQSLRVVDNTQDP